MYKKALSTQSFEKARIAEECIVEKIGGLATEEARKEIRYWLAEMITWGRASRNKDVIDLQEKLDQSQNKVQRMREAVLRRDSRRE